MSAMPALARRPRQQPTGEPPIRLLIVDDSAVARAVLSRIVSSNPGFDMVSTEIEGSYRIQDVR